MRNALVAPWLALALVAIPALADGSDGSELLVRRALAAHPSLESLRQQVDALQSRVTQASARPEPVIAIEYAGMPVDAPLPGRHPMSGVQLRVQQTLLAPGTIPHRVDAAEARVRVGERTLDELRVTLAAEVRRQYWQLAWNRQLQQVTRSHVAQIDALLDAVRAGYEVGEAGQHQLLHLRVLRGRLADDLAEHDRAERELLAALAAAVASDGPLSVSTPAQLPVPPPPTADEATRVRDTHPRLQRLRAAETAERAAAGSARRESWPELTVWAGYRVRTPVDGIDEGTNQASLGLSVALPTAASRRWGARVAEHEARARGVGASAQAARDELRADLDAATARWHRAADRVDVHRDGLIPDARSALDATLAAYRVGRADFAALVQAEIQLLDLERAATDAAAAALLAEVEVTRALGIADRGEDGGTR